MFKQRIWARTKQPLKDMAITKHKVFPLPQMAAGKANNINEGLKCLVRHGNILSNLES